MNDVTPSHLAERMTIARSPRKMRRRAAIWILVLVAASLAYPVASNDAVALATWAKNLLAGLLGGAMILSGFCAASLILKLFIKSGDMELTKGGFRFLPRDMGNQIWMNCGEFEVGNGLFVAVRYRVHATDKSDGEGQPEFNRWIPNHYDLAPKELAATLNAFRSRALDRAVS